MTTNQGDRAQIRVGPDGRFKAPIRLFRHSRYTVTRKRNGELLFTPVQDSAFGPRETADEEGQDDA